MDFESPDWTPKSHIAFTDAGMVIEIELSGVQRSGLEIINEANQVCIRGRRKDIGSFESRFHVPPGYSPENAKTSFANGNLRIEIPPNNDSLPKPVNMLI